MDEKQTFDRSPGTGRVPLFTNSFLLFFLALKHNMYIENFGLGARNSRNQVRDQFFTILQLGASGGGPGAP